MSAEIFTNNASTTLGTAIGAGDTSITVATGTGSQFPSPGAGQYFTATLWAAGSTTGVPNEIVKVTARSGDTMTVVRGQEGTTPQAWGVGDTFANYPTAAFFNGLAGTADIQAQSGNYAVDGGSKNAGTATLSPAITALSAVLGAPIRIKKMGTANDSTYTLNLNGLGAKSVTLNGSALNSGMLPASQVFEVIWDGTNFELISPPAVPLDNNIANAKLAQMAANTLKGNLTGSTANAGDFPLSSVLSWLGFTTGANYIILPGGTIIQWGFPTSSATPGAAKAVSFPIAFPNLVQNAPVLSCVNTSSSDSNAWADNSVTLTGFNLRCNIASIGCQYIVIGK